MLRRCHFWRIILLALLSLAILSGASLADALPEPFEGYFVETNFIRPKPDFSAKIEMRIPAYTPVLLTPVDDRFALVSYGGVTGYTCYVKGEPVPEDEALDAPFTGYITRAMALLDVPLAGGNTVRQLEAETPMLVTAKAGLYYRVEVEGASGYLYRGDVKPFGFTVQQVAEASFYVSSGTDVRTLPLAAAPVAGRLEPGRVYRSAAVSRGFYQLSLEDGAVGYVDVDDVTPLKADRRVQMVARVDADVALFTQPDEGFAAEGGADGARLSFIDGENNGFYHLAAEGCYVRAGDVSAYAVYAIDSLRLYAGEDVALTLSPSGEESAGVSLQAGRLYTASYTAGDCYLLEAEGVWGFLRQDSASVSSLVDGAAMNRTAAALVLDTELYTPSGDALPLAQGSKVFLTHEAGDFYRCEVGRRSGYVLRGAVRLVASDIPLDAYTIAAPQDIPLMDFPDSALAAACGVIPAGEAVTVTAANRCYLLVQCGALTGYAAQEGLLTAETEGLPTTEDVPAYELVLDKSTCMVYAFVLDEDGARTGEIAQSAMVAIGKRTTPTPSGTFTLGAKERWHRFTNSYTPHTTLYTRGRYIHGLPCRSRSTGSVINYMAHNAGQKVTGGCLRSPFEFARWVYLNCPSYQTVLTVVSGGLEVPATMTELPQP